MIQPTLERSPNLPPVPPPLLMPHEQEREREGAAKEEEEGATRNAATRFDGLPLRFRSFFGCRGEKSVSGANVSQPSFLSSFLPSLLLHSVPSMPNKRERPWNLPANYSSVVPPHPQQPLQLGRGRVATGVKGHASLQSLDARPSAIRTTMLLIMPAPGEYLLDRVRSVGRAIVSGVSGVRIFRLHTICFRCMV